MEPNASPARRAGPLADLRVVEFAGIGPGPFACMLLSDMGADVVTIDRPGARASDPRNVTQRGRTVVQADLKDAACIEQVLQLLQAADVLIEGMRPGVMERLGLGPEECLKVNPKLVYGRMTGWGQTGPLAPRAGHDNNYASVAGALWGCSPADARPVSSFAMVGDIGGGALYLITGVLAGVTQARQTGQGTVVDAAIVDGSAHMLNLGLSTRQRGVLADERGKSVYDSAPFYDTYVCADGHHITIGAIEPQFYALLLEILDLKDDADFASPQADQAAWPKRRARLQSLFLQHPRAHWQQVFESTDVCFGAVLSPLEASQHPHMQARGVYNEQGGVLQAAPAPRFDGKAYDTPEICAAGAHTDAVLGALSSGDTRGVWR